MTAKLNRDWLGLPAGTELVVLGSIPWEHGNNCYLVQRADGEPFPLGKPIVRADGMTFPRENGRVVPIDPFLIMIEAD